MYPAPFLDVNAKDFLRANPAIATLATEAWGHSFGVPSSSGVNCRIDADPIARDHAGLQHEITPSSGTGSGPCCVRRR